MKVQKTGLMLSVGFLAAIGVQQIGAQAVGENLFKNNPGFEGGADWWNLDQRDSATGTIAYDDPMAVHTGSKGAKVVVTAVDGQNWHVQLQCPPQFEAVKTNDYQLSFWGRTNSLDGKPVHVAIQDGAPDYAYRAGSDYRLDTAWKKIERTWTSDVEGLESLRFNLFLGSDTGTYYFDDFTLTTTAAPVGLRNLKLSGKAPLRNPVAVPEVDAAGRSGKSGNSSVRTGILFSR